MIYLNLIWFAYRGMAMLPNAAIPLGVVMTKRSNVISGYPVDTLENYRVSRFERYAEGVMLVLNILIHLPGEAIRSWRRS